MGAFGDLPHGRWVRDHNPGFGIARGQRSSLAGSLILAGALALLLWRATSEIASGSDNRGVSIGTPVPGVSANDRRYALIVSVGRYDDPSLRSLEGPGRGAEQLHDALTTHAGFASTNIRRVDGSGPDAMIPTRGNVLRALHEVLARVPADGNAMLLVSFTGQGTVANGKAYLLPQDASAGGGDALLASTSIDFDREIKQRLLDRRIKQLILLVDSTIGGSGPAPRLSADFVKSVTFEARPPLEAVAVLHATSAGSSSYADSAMRSIFIHAFVEGMQGAAGRAADGWITLGSLLRYVQETVPVRAARIDATFRQHPVAAIDGFLPNEIRFARVASRTASSTADLRCALRSPGSSADDLYVFDVAATTGNRTPTAVEAVHVVNGGVLGTPFGRPVPLTSPREWPIRRVAAGAPLLAVAHTNIGKCAAYLEAESVQSPVYQTRWRSTNAEGMPYREVFKHTTENRHGRTDVVAAGTETLRDLEGRITRVEYSCEGAPCGWSYHPEIGRGLAGDVTVLDPPHTFSWRRRWEGDSAIDTYTAFYEMPVRVCVQGCP